MADKESGRIEAFSDGMFAFSITLLVLELKVPRLGEYRDGANLASALVAQWPSFAAYLISFSTILIMWSNHHRLFNWIRKVDSKLLYYNGLLLLFVSMLPYPTAIFAEHFTRPGSVIACAVFCGDFFLIAVAFNLLWHHLRRRHHALMPEMQDHEISRISRSYHMALWSYATAFAFAFINKYMSVGIVTALAIYFGAFSYGSQEAD